MSRAVRLCCAAVVRRRVIVHRRAAVFPKALTCVRKARVTERRIIGLHAAGLVLLALLGVQWIRVPAQPFDLTKDEHALRFEGFSAPEGDARWSLNDHPRLRFNRPLPREFTLRVSGRAAASTGTDVFVRVAGGRPQLIHFPATGTTQDIALVNPWLASAIDWSVVPLHAESSREPKAAVALTGLELLR